MANPKEPIETKSKNQMRFWVLMTCFFVLNGGEIDFQCCLELIKISLGPILGRKRMRNSIHATLVDTVGSLAARNLGSISWARSSI